MRSVNSTPRAGRPGFVQGLANETLDSLEKIIEVSKRPAPVEYPETELGRRMKLAGQMVTGSYPARILYLSQGGYDTHARQGDAHASLLEDLSEALTAFYRHVEKAGAAERVTVMVFSEFGRRVRDNGSGTDHGAGGLAFAIGDAVQGGMYGEYPSLKEGDLLEGDLNFGVDFRGVYGTMVERWLGLDAKVVVGGTFEQLAFV